MKQIIQVPKHAKLFVIGWGLLLWLDTFSGAFSDHDDIAAYFEEAATIGGFMLWMKVAQPLMKTNISFSFKSGLKIWKRVPTAVGKVVWGIALGFGAVMWGNSFANSVLDAKNQFSRYVPEREDWFHKHGFDDDFQSSRLLNKIEGWVMYDLVDGVSQIRIGWSDAPHNRFIDWRDGMDTFMWNSGIDIATDPIEYMSYTARTVDDWNVRADVFRENALWDIKALLEKYSEKQDESNPLTSTLELLRSQKLEYETKLQAARKEWRDEYIQIYQRKLRSLQEQIQVFQETLDHETNPEERQKRFIKQVRNIIGNPEWVPLRYVNIRIYDQIIALFTAKEWEWYNALISGTTKPEFFTYIVDKELAKLRIDQEPESEKKGEYVLWFEADMLEEEMFISIALDWNTEGVEIARMRLLNNRWEVSRQMMSMDDLDFISRLPQKERDFLRKITERTLSRVRILNKGYYINHEDQKVSKDEGDIHKEYIWYSLKYTDSHHENPESNYSLTYIPSHDEIMWEYFTKWIDENITGQRILQDMQMKKIKDTAESGEVNDGETPSTPTTASKMFFRFYDRIVDLKRSQVFIANIQDRGTGRAWQSDSLEGEIEEIIGVPLRTTIRQGIAASPLLGTWVMLVDMLQKK